MSGIRPDSAAQIKLADLAVLQGLDPAEFVGFVSLLVPRDPARAPVLISDAPDPGSLIAVLSAGIHTIAARLAQDPQARWQR